MIDASGRPLRGSSPCPRWCDGSPGHPYGDLDQRGCPLRWHTREIGPHVDLVLAEVETEPLDPSAVRLSVMVDQLADVDAAGARRIAAELLNGADALDAALDDSPGQ